MKHFLLLSLALYSTHAFAAETLELLKWAQPEFKQSASAMTLLKTRSQVNKPVGVVFSSDVFENPGAYVVKMFDFYSESELQKARVEPSIGVTKVQSKSLAVSHREDLFALAGLSMDVPILDASFKEVTRLREHRSESADVTFSKDDSQIALTAMNGTVWIYNTQGEVLHVLEKSQSEPSAKFVRFTSQQDELLTVGNDGYIFWDVKSEKPSQSGKFTVSGARAIDFSPDGTLIAIANNNEGAATLYKYPSFELVQTFKNKEDCNEGFPCPANEVAFSNNGKCLVVSTYKTNHVKLVATGEDVATSMTGAGSDFLSFDASGKLLVGAGGPDYYIFKTPSPCL